ncbi:hypothetical protein P692DRAFT_201908493 [Suillus brevipes Sb2]|nr:hypothetical protein P692DRAFT_201908493 [Suillus brevipes Sb2]
MNHFDISSLVARAVSHDQSSQGPAPSFAQSKPHSLSWSIFLLGVTRSLLGTQKARTHMDVYFTRTKEHGPDGWAVAGGNSLPRVPPKASDLSIFLTSTTSASWTSWLRPRSRARGRRLVGDSFAQATSDGRCTLEGFLRSFWTTSLSMLPRRLSVWLLLCSEVLGSRMSLRDFVERMASNLKYSDKLV